MALIAIPIEFEYEGIQFAGYFTKVPGAGYNDVYHLNLHGYHYGQLWKARDQWCWGANAKELFNEQFMLEFFVNVIEQYFHNNPQ